MARLLRLAVSNVCTAFKTRAVGTRVVTGCHRQFIEELEDQVAAHGFEDDRVPGQGYIRMFQNSHRYVMSGVGRRTEDPADYILAFHRGRVNTYLRRSKAAPVESLACIVYTRAAYLADPDTKTDQVEFTRITGEEDITHVIVAVLASAGPTAPLTPHRFLENLSGGNREALEWSADEIRLKATEIVAYDKEWCVVADS